MKEKIQAKINHYHKLAKGHVKVSSKENVETFRSKDSLSNAVRNKKEADIFIAELNAAVEIALTQ